MSPFEHGASAPARKKDIPDKIERLIIGLETLHKVWENHVVLLQPILTHGFDKNPPKQDLGIDAATDIGEQLADAIASIGRLQQAIQSIDSQIEV